MPAELKKAVLISIQPDWVDRILAGEKIAELRKSFPNPKMLTPPFTVYIYETQGKASKCRFDRRDFGAFMHGCGMVVGKFTCTGYDTLTKSAKQGKVDISPCKYKKPSFAPVPPNTASLSDYCLTADQVLGYIGDRKGYGWRISDLKEFSVPMRLSQFSVPGRRAPQSWCYIPYPAFD